MIAEKAADCRKCGKHLPLRELSHQRLCYECAKARMVWMFDQMWNMRLDRQAHAKS